MMRDIGVLGAMDVEVERLLSLLQAPETVRVGDLEFHRGTIGGQGAVVVKCGIGKVNAARYAQAMIDRFAPAALINTGIAGGLDARLSVGDVVIGTELVQHDFDVTGFGYAKGYLCTGENGDRPTIFHADRELTELVQQATTALIPKEHVWQGRVATGDLFVSGVEAKREIFDTFGAFAAEMEGAAIAQVAHFAGTPFVVLRAISDLADGTAAVSYETFERKAAELSASVVERVLHLLAQRMQ